MSTTRARNQNPPLDLSSRWKKKKQGLQNSRGKKAEHAHLLLLLVDYKKGENKSRAKNPLQPHHEKKLRDDMMIDCDKSGTS